MLKETLTTFEGGTLNSHVAAAIATERSCDIQEDVARGRAVHAASGQSERGALRRWLAAYRCALRRD
jgi:hypothetical protein